MLQADVHAAAAFRATIVTIIFLVFATMLAFVGLLAVAVTWGDKRASVELLGYFQVTHRSRLRYRLLAWTPGANYFACKSTDRSFSYSSSPISKFSPVVKWILG